MREIGATYRPAAVSQDWRRLYEDDAPALLRYLAKLTRDTEAANELMQETFIRAITADPQLPGHDAARAWLFRTATNLARNEHRRRLILAFVPFSG